MTSRQRNYALTLTALLPLALPARAQDLPEGAGRELVEKVCTQCHDVARILSKHWTKEEWNETVDKMAVRGAKATDEEFESIVNYLAKFFGKEPSSEKSKLGGSSQ